MLATNPTHISHAFPETSDIHKTIKDLLKNKPSDIKAIRKAIDTLIPYAQEKMPNALDCIVFLTRGFEDLFVETMQRVGTERAANILARESRNPNYQAIPQTIRALIEMAAIPLPGVQRDIKSLIKTVINDRTEIAELCDQTLADIALNATPEQAQIAIIALSYHDYTMTGFENALTRLKKMKDIFHIAAKEEQPIAETITSLCKEIKECIDERQRSAKPELREQAKVLTNITTAFLLENTQ